MAGAPGSAPAPRSRFIDAREGRAPCTRRPDFSLAPCPRGQGRASARELHSLLRKPLTRACARRPSGIVGAGDVSAGSSRETALREVEQGIAGLLPARHSPGGSLVRQKFLNG